MVFSRSSSHTQSHFQTPKFSHKESTFTFHSQLFFFPLHYHHSSLCCNSFSAARLRPSSITNVAPDRARDRHKIVKVPWEKLIWWSHSWRSKAKTDILERTKKVVVLGEGSFGTAMAAHVANKKNQLEVYMLVCDLLVCQSINETHCNCPYFPEHNLPENVIETTDTKVALLSADYCLHAVPVQFSSSFPEGITDYVDQGLPFISLCKGF